MSHPTPKQVVKLYRDLLRYSKSLKFTDKEYFMLRVNEEFRNNQYVQKPNVIEFCYQVSALFSTLLFKFAHEGSRTFEEQEGGVMVSMCATRGLATCRAVLVSKKLLDFSLVPKLVENDLEIQFVRGSGPGGQATNKTSNCVVLKHKPTGIVVKSHQTRSQAQNLQMAKERLVTRLDNLWNGEKSIQSQIKEIEQKKSIKADQRRKKLKELKDQWKEREGIT